MKVTEVLSKEELKHLSTRSDLAGWRLVLFTWGSIAAIFAMMAVWPNPLTIIAGLILLGGRQLGLAVIMHDAAHRSLFRTTRLNDFVGQWFGAAPIWLERNAYWSNHSKHHMDAGTPDDPDLHKYENYAVPRMSMARKVMRDLFGVTAYKTIRFNIRRLGWSYTLRPLLVTLLLAGVLYLCGAGWVFLVWVAAHLSSYQLIARLRNAAEHAVVPDLQDPDPRRHTRTTKASWWERMTFAPNQVNFHLEHHLLPSIPNHRLREMHQTLASRGFYDVAEISPGYIDVFKRLTRPGGAESADVEHGDVERV